MKRYTIFFAILITFIFMGCNKDKLPQLIYAGQGSGEYTAYTKVDPPYQIIFEYPSSEENYEIDADGDGTPDLKFVFVGSGSSEHTSFSMNVESMEDAEVCTGSESTWAAMLLNDAIIDDNKNWTNKTLIMHNYNYTYESAVELTGDWTSEGTYFIGFRIKDGKDYRYGWVKITTENGASWVFSSYAIISNI